MELTGASLVIITEAELKEQLGVGEPPVTMLHERVTLPVYPPAGVTVIVEVEVFPAVTDPGFIAAAVSVKLGLAGGVDEPEPEPPQPLMPTNSAPRPRRKPEANKRRRDFIGSTSLTTAKFCSAQYQPGWR